MFDLDLEKKRNRNLNPAQTFQRPSRATPSSPPGPNNPLAPHGPACRSPGPHSSLLPHGPFKPSGPALPSAPPPHQRWPSFPPAPRSSRSARAEWARLSVASLAARSECPHFSFLSLSLTARPRLQFLHLPRARDHRRARRDPFPATQCRNPRPASFKPRPSLPLRPITQPSPPKP